MKDVITYPLSDFLEPGTVICERCRKELPPSDVDLFTGLCWPCIAEIEDDKREAARWNFEQMESAKEGGWECT